MVETWCSKGVRLPVGKIVCVGRNYEAHAREMKAPRPQEPMLFLKPSTSLLFHGGEVPLPDWSKDIHHEIELVVRIGVGMLQALVDPGVKRRNQPVAGTRARCRIRQGKPCILPPREPGPPPRIRPRLPVSTSGSTLCSNRRG